MIEALTRALDAARPAVAARPHAAPVEDRPQPLPDQVRSSIVTVAGFEGPLRDHLEAWAQEAMAFGMDEAEVARKIFEGDNE